MYRPRVKICGITSLEDALLCIANGVDALGFILWSGSKRAITLPHAQHICTQLPPWVHTVGLFVNPSAAEVHDALQHPTFSILQFHGDESPTWCESFHFPYMKALRVKDVPSTQHAMHTFSQTHYLKGILLDAWSATQYGGTGMGIAEESVHTLSTYWYTQHDAQKKVIVSGGLSPDNIRQKIHDLRPYAVDACSHLEAEPGIKCPEKVRLFMEAVSTTS